MASPELEGGLARAARWIGEKMVPRRTRVAFPECVAGRRYVPDLTRSRDQKFVPDQTRFPDQARVPDQRIRPAQVRS
jgi:hypothetical protein